MKKWLKKHWKGVFVILGIIFIANSVHGLFTAKQDYVLLWHAFLVLGWSVVVFCASGLCSKFLNWWEKE